MSDWTYFNPVKVVFAPGSVSRLAEYVPFRRVVLVTSPGFTRRGVTVSVRESLGERLVHVLDDVKPNPDVRDIDAQAVRIRGLQPDCILALGGGSSMDTAKALAKLMSQPEGVSVTRHFREGGTWEKTTALPLITVPTTAGTGSEVTPFATVWDFENQKKHSVNGDEIYAHTALLDPELTYSLPEEVTIASALDAISHAFESIWNRNTSPASFSFAVQSLKISLDTIVPLADDLRCKKYRRQMMEASLLAGMAISQTRTALAHSISYPLTTAFDLPHGFACSFTLPAILQFNGEHDDGRLERVAQFIGVKGVMGIDEVLRRVFDGIGLKSYFRKYLSVEKDVAKVVMNNFNPLRAKNNMSPINRGQLKILIDNAGSDLGY